MCSVPLILCQERIVMRGAVGPVATCTSISITGLSAAGTDLLSEPALYCPSRFLSKSSLMVLEKKVPLFSKEGAEPEALQINVGFFSQYKCNIFKKSFLPQVFF